MQRNMSSSSSLPQTILTALLAAPALVGHAYAQEVVGVFDDAVQLGHSTIEAVPVDANDSAALGCAAERISLGGCDKSACATTCALFDSEYLKDKCCAHASVNANLLAFERSDTWIPRLAEYNECTGANIRISYVEDGEDGMSEALILDVGTNEDEESGAGIYDAYIVQAPWLPSVFKGLKGLSDLIAEDDEYIEFSDINPASQSAVSFGGEVRALPLDTDYIALGWRQDVFDNEEIKKVYFDTWGEELKVPDTIEELVEVSEKLNGRFDFNNDGEKDWGFCLTPQTNYFQAFLAPIMQTHTSECETLANGDGPTGTGYRCLGKDNGQNMFFDVDNMEPLIFNVSDLFECAS